MAAIALLPVRTLLVLSALCISCMHAVSMLPFGSSLGDGLLAIGDDSPNLFLNFQFNYFGVSVPSVFVNNNGLITTSSSYSGFVSSSFPLSSVAMIAPYWCDVDTRPGGTVSSPIAGVEADRVYARVDSSSSATQSSIQSYIRAAFPSDSSYTPSRSLIATWYRVGRFANRYDLLNSFQAVITTNGQRSYVMFLYPPGGIEWVTSDSSGFPQAGFNAGDGVISTSLPDSRTAAIQSIATASNVGVSGLWVYRVDGTTIVSAPNPPSTVCVTVGTTSDCSFTTLTAVPTTLPSNTTFL